MTLEVNPLESLKEHPASLKDFAGRPIRSGDTALVIHWRYGEKPCFAQVRVDRVTAANVVYRHKGKREYRVTPENVVVVA